MRLFPKDGVALWRMRPKKRPLAQVFGWWLGSALVLLAMSVGFYLLFQRSVERTLERFQHSMRVVVNDTDRQMHGVDTSLRLLRVEAEHYLNEDTHGVYAPWFPTLVAAEGDLFYTSRLPEGMPLAKGSYLFGKGGIPKPGSKRMNEMKKILALDPLFAEAKRRILGASWVYYVSMEGFTNLYPFTGEDMAGKLLWDDAAMGMDNLFKIMPQSNPERGVHWMDAYVDHAGKGAIISALIPMYDRQSLYRGFIAIDFTLNDLKQILSPAHFKDGAFYVVNNSAQVLLSSRQMDMGQAQNLATFLPETLRASQDTWLPQADAGCTRMKDWYLCRQNMNQVPWQALFVVDRASVVRHSIAGMWIEAASLALLILVLIAFARYRHLAENQRKWGKRYQRILESSDQGFGEWHIQNRAFAASAMFDSLFGHPHRNFKTRGDWMKHIHPEDVASVRSALSGYLSGRRPLSVVTFRVRAPDGSWRWLMAHGKVVEYDRRGRPEIVTGTLTDITEQKMNEAALLLAKQVADQAREVAETANIAKSRFLATASHDLRQPVQAGNLFISILKRSELEPEQRKIVHNLEQVGRSLDELLEALLEISRLDAGTITPQLEPVEIQDIFQRIESEFASLALEKKLRFKFFFPDRPLVFLTDTGIFMRIVRNLVDNAIRYTEEGGVLVGVRLREKEGRRFLLFQVWDTGIGIQEEYMGRIYEEFFQVDNPPLQQRRGLGLGLAITSRFSGLLGYGIRCASRYERGSLFEVSIPLPVNELQISEMPHSEEPDDFSVLQGKFCILIEDDPLVSEAFVMWLESWGMNCLCFSDSGSVLAAPEIHKADFFITDFRIQGKLNGIKLLEALQESNNRPIRGIVVTGGASRDQIVSAMHDSVNWPVLYKPVGAARLLKTLLQLWQEQPFRVSLFPP
ncbi:MAG: PAS domain-containing protein [Zoogloeaceae bacterium]|nr:PAS domain-containing protein [Zoogloeaceae bacterium]